MPGQAHPLELGSANAVNPCRRLVRFGGSSLTAVTGSTRIGALPADAHFQPLPHRERAPPVAALAQLASAFRGKAEIDDVDVLGMAAGYLDIPVAQQHTCEKPDIRVSVEPQNWRRGAREHEQRTMAQVLEHVKHPRTKGYAIDLLDAKLAQRGSPDRRGRCDRLKLRSPPPERSRGLR